MGVPPPDGRRPVLAAVAVLVLVAFLVFFIIAL
jgi:hypothetical protein